MADYRRTEEIRKKNICTEVFRKLHQRIGAAVKHLKKLELGDAWLKNDKGLEGLKLW